MAGSLIFLDTSILEQTLRESSLRSPTMKLLQSCKEEGGLYQGCFSCLSIQELSEKGYSSHDLEKLVGLLNEYSISLIWHIQPREVDFLFKNMVFQRKRHCNEIRFDNEFVLYSLAFFGYSKIEYYATWDYERINNYQFRRCFFRSLLMAGYNPSLTKNDYNCIQDPQYFLKAGEQRQNIDHKNLAYLSSERFSVKGESVYKYEELQGRLLKRPLIAKIKKKEVTPSIKIGNTRIPKKLTEETVKDVGFSVYDYLNDLGEENIPLVRLPTLKWASGKRHIRLFKLKTEKGHDFLKGLIDDVIFYRPQEEEIEWGEELYREEKIKDLMNWILPLVKESVEHGLKGVGWEETYRKRCLRERIVEVESLHVERGEFKRVFTQRLDGLIAGRFCIDEKQFYEIKFEATKLMLLLLGEEWESTKYWTFHTDKRWNTLQRACNPEDASPLSTYLCFERNGHEVIVILLDYELWD